jgi:propionate CoA-transferase
VNGVGGFVNISQAAKKIVFCGSFTAGGLEVSYSNEKLKILREGRTKKFVQTIDQISYSATHGARNKQEVKFITERGVIELHEGQLILTEVAPGINILEDVVNQSSAYISISDKVKIMDKSIFQTTVADECKYEKCS